MYLARIIAPAARSAVSIFDLRLQIYFIRFQYFFVFQMMANTGNTFARPLSCMLSQSNSFTAIQNTAVTQSQLSPIVSTN